ncbi:MAG: hypothetical protein RMK49_05565 [Abditibacteriales bacterium]|nr:hypothetical protein [Abditibacteriales bacterium]
MTPEQHLQKAQQLAQALSDVDDNEVKKVYSFLCRQRQMSALHQLVEALPESPFKDRSKSTPHYYRRMKEVIPRHLPESMNLDDAVQILGWACRLLKYEALKRNQRSSQPKSPPKGKSQKGGQRR